MKKEVTPIDKSLLFGLSEDEKRNSRNLYDSFLGPPKILIPPTPQLEFDRVSSRLGFQHLIQGPFVLGGGWTGFSSRQVHRGRLL